LISVWACGSDSDSETDTYDGLHVTYGFGKPHVVEVTSQGVLLQRSFTDSGGPYKVVQSYPSGQMVRILWTTTAVDTIVAAYQFSIKVNGELIHEEEGEALIGFGYSINPS